MRLGTFARVFWMLGVCFANIADAFLFSLGIAIHPDHGKSRDAISRTADVALYRAQNDGRDCARLAN